MVEKDQRKYIFVGNRSYVLEEMIRRGLDIKSVWIMENSFFHKMLDTSPAFLKGTQDVRIVRGRRQLLDLLGAAEFDVLVSNGCKYVLPVSQLRRALYINVHPSYLPDLKGKDPVNGACLFGRAAGAACHIMDDGIDTGRIIARVQIPMTDDIEAGLLFQLCFKAEVIAFQDALARNFEPLTQQPSGEGALYYSMTPSEQLINFEKGFDFVLRQARAFSYQSKGLYFRSGERKFHFYGASEIKNPFVTDYCKHTQNLQVAFVFENTVVFKFEGRIMRFDQVDWADGRLSEGDLLTSCQEGLAG